MKLKENQRNLIVTLALGSAVVVYIVFVFLPTQRSIASLQDELDGHQNYIAQQQSANVSAVSLEGELRATREFSLRWKSVAPDANRLAPVSAQLSRCATEANVATLQFDPQPVEPLALLARAPVAMVCEGEFEQIFDFLRRIEALPQTIWIEHLRLSKPSDDSDRVRCELTMIVFADKPEISD